MRKKLFTKQLGLTISEEAHNRIIEETDREEKSISAWLREAIEKRLFPDRKGEDK